MRAGQVYKRGATWTFVVDVNPPGAPRRQRRRGGFPTKRKALAAMAELQADAGRGQLVEPSRVTLGTFLLQEWLPAAKPTVRATTFHNYRSHAERHILPRLGDHRLTAISGGTLNALYAELLAGGRLDGRGGLSPASVRRVHALLHRALGDAVRWGRLPRNPAADADPPREPRDRGMSTWTSEQLGAFLEHVRGDRLYPLWLLLATTGMRRGEAVGLRWTDVDLEARRAAIRQTLVAVGYEVQVSEPKTKRGRRSVALDTATVKALRDWRRQQLEERMTWGPAWQSTGLVFTREDGTTWHPMRISKLFDAHVKESGLPRIRLHDIRHSHASLALRAGVHPKVVSERLGHATVAMTLDVYSHAIPALQEDAAETVARLVLGGGL